jgi:hypothetical protein
MHKKNMNVFFNKDTSTHIDGRQLIPNPFKAIQTKNQFTSQVAKRRADKYKQFSKAGNSQSCGITLIVTGFCRPNNLNNKEIIHYAKCQII